MISDDTAQGVILYGWKEIANININIQLTHQLLLLLRFCPFLLFLFWWLYPLGLRGNFLGMSVFGSRAFAVAIMITFFCQWWVVSFLSITLLCITLRHVSQWVSNYILYHAIENVFNKKTGKVLCTQQYSKYPHIRTNGLRTTGWNSTNKTPFL